MKKDMFNREKQTRKQTYYELCLALYTDNVFLAGVIFRNISKLKFSKVISAKANKESTVPFA